MSDPMPHPPTAAPRACLLSNGRYTVMTRDTGSGFSQWRNLAVTRWRDDPTADLMGSYVLVRDHGTHDCWSVTAQPLGANRRAHTMRLAGGSVRFDAQRGAIASSLAIAVAQDVDGDVRRLMLHNRRDAACDLDVTSYAELVLGSMAGQWLSVMHKLSGSLWFWFGHQGYEYVDLGRVWQAALFIGLLLWLFLIGRTAIPALNQKGSAKSLIILYLLSTTGIALFYSPGLFWGMRSHISVVEYWRWWVVHLWVEQSFEFFAVAMSAYLLMALGLVSRKLAERSVYLELILIFLGGVLGTGHHLYWGGGPSMWVPLGTMFSFIEVLPLVLLILEAIQQHRLIKASTAFDYNLAYTFILGSAFWNFVGAGVFGGGTLNAPLVNYYEHGTFLTLNHAHTSLFGAFGLLALGLIYFCLRYRAGPGTGFNNRPGYWAFWLMNLGLVLWVVLHFFPIGWPQLDAVYEHGLAYARSQAFYDTTRFWQWMRLPGDVVFSLGTLIMAVDFIAKLRKRPGADVAM